MGSCKFKKKRCECPLDAEEGRDYCYWHQEIDGKKPTPDRLKELQNNQIYYVYLKNANLESVNMQKAKLNFANMQGANLKLTEMHEASLWSVNMQETCLELAELQGAFLWSANMRKAKLKSAELCGADLYLAELKEADLRSTNMQGANLESANLQGTDLLSANLQHANMKLTVFDSSSRLDYTMLKDANLYLSYIDHAKSFRNAHFFDQDDLNEKEINELIADTCYLKGCWTYQYGKEIIFDFEKIKTLYNQKTKDDLFLRKLKEICVIWPGKEANIAIEYKRVISAYENKELTKEEKQFFDDLVISKSFIGINFLVPANEDILVDIDKKELYEASKEVYSKLHHFYLNEGMAFRTKHAHYRRSDVDRKLLLVKHKWNSFEGIKDRARSWLFDWFVLKMLTGYGESILRPVLISIFWIIAFGFIYMALEGVKVVGRAANWFDYLYLSMTTFTSLGFADVQPNVSVTGMQPLIMAESTMGVAMVALIIFVITYQISR